MKHSVSQIFVSIVCWCCFVLATSFLLNRDAFVDAQSCPMTLWVFSNVNDCFQGKPADSIGTIYADGNCHTLKTDKATNQTQPLFPGNYAAECTADDNLHFLHSGCSTDMCGSSSLVDNAVCDADFSASSSLFVTNPTDRPVQDAGASSDGSYSCYFITGGTNGDLYVAFAVFGDCSAGCQVDGVAAPVAPTSRPVTSPTVATTDSPITVPVRSPTRTPVAAPLATSAPLSRAPNSAVNNTNDAATPSSLPTLAPVATSPSQTLPFRNSTTQGTASIPVNGSLTLPPPSSPEIRETILDFPKNGALRRNAEGSITYTPNPNFVGLDTFEVEQCINATGSNYEKKCETIAVAVEVTASSNSNATPPPTEPSSSSSSKGIYGLAALATIPVAFLFFMYHKKQAKKRDDCPSHAQTKEVVDGGTLGSGNRPPVSDVAWSVTVPPPVFGSNRSNHYLPSNKDQVRDVIPPGSDTRVDDISVITQSTTHHDNESFVPQPLIPEDPEDSNILSKNYQRGSGRLHPLAAHLIEVRSNSAGASQHDTVVTPSSVVAEPLAPPAAVVEPHARAINSVYGSTKRIIQEPDLGSSAEPVLVNAVLISDDEDISELQDTKVPANRCDI